MMITKEATLRGIVVVTLLVATGCSNKESYAGGDSTPETRASTSTPAMAGGEVAQPVSALTDANIVFILDQANAADSARGRLAESKGTSAEVKSFGRLMAGEHHALRAAGQQLARKLNVTPQAPAGDESEAQAKEEMAKLESMPKGKSWDKAYVDYEVGYHKAVIETATKALGEAKNDELKGLIKTAAPVLQHHLAAAETIQKKQRG
jgi:putative membrane protein